VSAPARLLAFVEQTSLQRLVNYNGTMADPQNVAASKNRLALFICPSDPANGQVPGLTDYGTNYVACNGTGVVVDALGNTVSYTKIPEGNGVFAQTPIRVLEVMDGASNTAAFSESTIGNAVVPPVGTPPADPRLVVLEVPGGGDPTPAACDGMAGVWAGNRGGQWINGHFGHTLYNHYYPPNPPDKWDCGNGSHNKALTAARSYHIGGVNLLLCDGSVRFVLNSVDIILWRAVATRAGNEVMSDF
jgi:prepilin-type processing-associated H-X9-DG protein